MTEITGIIVLVLSLAATSAGILITSHLRTTYKTDFFASLLLFQVFWFTFGYYALWGQIAITSMLGSGIEPALLGRIKNAALFLGSPFYVFAWLMMLKLAREISSRKAGGPFILTFLAVNFLLVPGAGYLVVRITGIQVMILLRYTFIFLSLVYAFTCTRDLVAGKNMPSRLSNTDTGHIALWIILIVMLQSILFFFSAGSEYLYLAFILVFFCFGAFLPLYFRYRADLSKLLVNGESNLTLDLFCEKYEISKREKEVIIEICKGLTNQQIAEKLFISLQTVKDHTHRIYGKAFCSSRAQLIRMVNELELSAIAGD